MTVRDGARYLAQAIESVRAQTLQSWELVVWDDGSRDDTLAIVRAFAAGEPRIRWFAGEPVGRRAALVEAHARARGAYLAWLDGDDWLAPDALAKAYAVITASGCDLVYTDHVVVEPDGELRGLGRRSRIPYSASRLLLDFMTFHLRVFTRAIFERVGGIAPDREIAIDYDLCLRISEHGRIKHLAEPLYFYRRHADQMSSRRRAEQIAASAAAIRAALVRRGLTTLALSVDQARGRFRLVPQPTVTRTSWPRIAAATVMPRWRPARGAATSIGHWPAARESVYRRQLYSAIQKRGLHARPLGEDLAQLVRAVWTGNAGDVLHIHGIAPLLAAPADGSVLAACLVFLKTIDHARARGMRVVSIVAEPVARHPVRQAWCLRQLAARCDATVTHWRDGVHRFVPHPDLGDGYPEMTREFARAALGLGGGTSRVYLGTPPDHPAIGDLVLDGDVDAYAPRHVAAYFAAADLAVLPRLSAGALALAMAMAKPIVAPAIAGAVGFGFGDRGIGDALERADAARDDWDAIGRANRARLSTWDATVDAVLA
ncbi:MAG: glycosyltransferase [Kofleriaceae bacterium]